MKTCACCGTELVRKWYEKPYQFEKRISCGKSCALRLRTKPVLSPSTRYRSVKVGGRKKQLSRHLMEQNIGRPLLRTELVHHVNHNKLDDRIDNYAIVDAAAHSRHHNQKYAETKACVICGANFAPPKTHRGHTQTCGARCKSALLSQRNQEAK